ncbi:MAG: cation-transporting P-type ATPase [Thermodesulfovibrionales bacterium]|nr:cation-transporting P-type ATPase [Thermodesulfovibrionales bacterium]
MTQLIHNSVKGRARFKVKGLYRSESLREFLEKRIIQIEGIKSFQVNTLTGNLLIFYDLHLDAQAIGRAIQNCLKEYQFSEDTEKCILTKPKKLEEKLTKVVSSFSLKNILHTPNYQNNINSLPSSPSFLKLDIIEGKKDTKTQPIKKKAILSSTYQRNSISRRKLKKSVINSSDQIMQKWHLMDIEDILNNFGVDKNCGLTSEIASKNLKKYGLNVLPESFPRSGFSIFIEQFRSIPVALLSIGAVISLLTGGLADALIIIAVVIINALIGYITESHAEKTIHSLKNLVRPTAFVLRDNKLLHIGAENVVLGDILILRPGSYVAADARLIEAQHLSIDESLLTGESMPVLKNASSLKSNPNMPDIPLAERYNMVYMGTIVTGGQGIAIVTATGRFTEIGKIQTLIEHTKPQKTPMEKQLSELGTQLVMISSFVCLAIFFIGITRGYGLLQMLKTSISLAVAAVPEGLPTIATTTLSLGIRNMRRHNVLIRHLNAVETLGCVQTICLDKTGTLTMNKMSVVLIHTGMKKIRVSEGRFEIVDSFIQNIKSEATVKYNLLQSDELLKLIKICALCSESEVKQNYDKLVVTGSPTENALIDLAVKSGIDVISLRKNFPLLGIKHRTERSNYMITIHDMRIVQSNGKSPKILAIKGSPLEVLSLCNYYLIDGKKVYLSDYERLKIEIENEKMAAEALRVLGVAYSFIDEKMLDGINFFGLKGNGSDVEFISWLLSVSKEITWLGLICISDPIKEGVKELIEEFHKAGIDTIMITGDQGPTAYAIGKKLNLSNHNPLEILDSTYLSEIKPEFMMAMCNRVKVFSRASPAHKLQIVQALQATGKVVAMTGDGINDGPALKAANIGIAMGQKGTDVAREVADIILEDDNMETMIIAIKQGRTIYNNIRKSVHFLLSTNLSEIMLMFSAMALGLGQPLSAMQLLWINLISDITPGLALSLEPPEPDVLISPPRDPNEPIINTTDFKRISFESAILSASALTAYCYGIARYGISQKASTIAFLSLSTGQILHSISCRSRKTSIFSKEKTFQNNYLKASVLGSLAFQVLALTIPGLKSLLGISAVSFIDFSVIGCSAITPLLINEASKNSLII